MPHLLLVDDDLFRESLGLNLVDEGYEVTSFDNGQDALAYLNDGSADVMLLDWRMPNLTGIDVLRRMRGAGINIPVIFLTVLSEDIYEQAALEGGAVDFIDKARRLPILLKRLRLIAEGGRAAPEPEPVRAPSRRLGQLMLCSDTNRASWAERAVDLTLTEFRIVALLAEKAGQDVGYREIYDLVHGKDFVAGHGSEGYRANVHTPKRRMNPPRAISGSGYRSPAAMPWRWAGQSRRKTERHMAWRCIFACRSPRAVTKGVVAKLTARGSVLRPIPA